MNNKKDYLNNEVIAEFKKKYEAIRGKDKANDLDNKTVGNNGYYVNQEFTLTGEITWKETNINGSTVIYWVLLTEDGSELSLMSLMGVSSLKNYSNTPIEVEYFIETKMNNKKTEEKQTRLVTPDYLPLEEDFSNVWKPSSRHLLTLVNNIMSGEENLAGKTAKFLGTAVKPFKAKADGENNGEKFHAGYQRAIETKLWSIF